MMSRLVLSLAFLSTLLLIPPAGRATDVAKGADVGWLPQMEASGYKFYDHNGKAEDCLKILKDQGVDTIRLRVFVNPSQDPRSGHCSRDEVVEMAARARAMGFRILIDFHYSDSWADPEKQTKPAAWQVHTFDELKKDVFDHTVDVLGALKTKGVIPEWVQVGNEIKTGMLWPDGKRSNGKNLAELINSGYRAVKSVDPASKVIVHLDRGNDSAYYRRYFDDLQHNGAHYDVIGMSYYPFWLHVDYTKNINDLGSNLVDMAARFHKEVMIVEVGGEQAKAQNTRELLRAVLKKVRAVPEHKGIGVVYWEPEGEASWSHYQLSCWGADGKPTEALQAFLENPTSSSH
jgi:arabinogalactan endo-1,4-beta-galactosidase